MIMRYSQAPAATLMLSPSQYRRRMSSSMPGEARLEAGDRKCVAKSRIINAAVCQPLAISPPKWPRAAAAGSVCMACGS